jgi:2-dehydro-3-deoxyphosphooctonate aldolase (KDO 8-P synthase)
MNMNAPLIIAGPCLAESFELLDEAAAFLNGLASSLRFQLVFKASFDKANRTSIKSTRGPGLVQGCDWLGQIKEKYSCRVITDVHETSQVGAAAEVCDSLQIPAFLCRQTDLLVAAVQTGRQVNIKKGQFMAPGAAKFVLSKVREVCEQENLTFSASLTERGSSFGYGDLVVDMRSLAIMAEFGAPIIFDITHSTQQPPTGAVGISGADRRFAPVLARAAAATGYLSGFFMEVHPRPMHAKSDAQAQLNFAQAEALLQQLIPLWQQSAAFAAHDGIFLA